MAAEPSPRIGWPCPLRQDHLNVNRGLATSPTNLWQRKMPLKADLPMRRRASCAEVLTRATHQNRHNPPKTHKCPGPHSGLCELTLGEGPRHEYFSFLNLFFLLLIFTRGHAEQGREREKLIGHLPDMSGLGMSPTPGLCPDQESIWQPFWCTGRH